MAECEICGRKRGSYAEAAETLAHDSDDFMLCPGSGVGSCYRLGYVRAQAKLEQAERELAVWRDEDGREAKYAWVSKQATAAESALAAAQGALREALAWLDEHPPECQCDGGEVESATCPHYEYGTLLDTIRAALAAESGKPGGEARGQAARDALAVLNARDEQWREALREGMEKIGSSAIMYAPKLYDLFTAAYRAELIASAGLPPAAESGSVVLGPHRHIEANECVPAYSAAAEPRAAPPAPRHVHDGSLKCSCGAIGPFDAPKAPPALPAELSGKGEQRFDGFVCSAPSCACGEQFSTYEAYLHHLNRVAEPGEAKKEEGT